MGEPYHISAQNNTYKVIAEKRNEIGQGRFGTVYEGTNRKNEKVAVKCIPMRNILPELLRNIESTTPKLLTLNNENLAKLFDVCKEEDFFWIFMEYCPDGSLQKYFGTKKTFGKHSRFTTL